MQKRLQELDSLRGLAALTVVFSHFSWIPALTFLRKTPMRVFLGGHEAVMIFFVLSGFVLSLAFFSGKNISYPSFIIKRVFRIYVPYLVAILFAMAGDLYLARGGIPQLGDWFNSIWTIPVTWDLVLNHILLVGSYNTTTIDPVIWSLVHEMRISLIFPLIILIINRYDWKPILVSGVLLSVIGGTLTYLSNRLNYGNDYFLTLHYVLMFVMGALLAKYREEMIRWYRELNAKFKLVVTATGCCLYFGGRILSYLAPSLIQEYVFDWLVALGAAIIVLIALSSNIISKGLTARPIAFLGKISYSLYLYHAVVLVAFLNVFYGLAPIWLILVSAFIAAILIATVSMKFVENPAMELGRKLGGNRLNDKSLVKIPH